MMSVWRLGLACWVFGAFACSADAEDRASGTSNGGTSSGGTLGGGTSSGGASSGGASGGAGSSAGASGNGGSGGGEPAIGFTPERGCTGTGTFAHGELVTLSCAAGFGEHADFSASGLAWNGHAHLAFRFKDFEDGQIEGQGFSIAIAPSQWSLETSLCPASSKGCGKRVYLEDERGALEAVQEGTTGTWYASFKMRASSELQSGKFFRIWGGEKNLWLSTGCDDLTLRGAPEYMQGETVWGSPDAFVADTWHRVEIVAKESGSVSTYLDGKLQWTRDWITAPFGADGHTIDIGHMLDKPGADRCAAHPAWSGATYYDDIFYDFTLARLEIADTFEWDARQRSEVQIPVSWQKDSVTIAVNRGEHAALSGKYLFFVDAAGVAQRIGKLD